MVTSLRSNCVVILLIVLWISVIQRLIAMGSQTSWVSLDLSLPFERKMNRNFELVKTFEGFLQRISHYFLPGLRVDTWGGALDFRHLHSSFRIEKAHGKSIGGSEDGEKVLWMDSSPNG